MTHISQILLEMLVRDGMSVGSLAGDDTQGMGAGMLEGTAHPLTAQAGENREPMRMGKRTPTEAGASFQEVRKRHAQEPSPARGRPVPLTLIDGGSRYKGVSTAPLYLVQT